MQTTMTSLLALMADKFELEEPDDDDSRSPEFRRSVDDDDECQENDTNNLLHDVNKTSRHMSISQDDTNSQEETKLLITFLLMVIVGTANKVFQKLQAIPMYNYPNSLNLLQK